MDIGLSYIDPNDPLLLGQQQPSLATGQFKSSGWDPFGVNGSKNSLQNSKQTKSKVLRRSSNLKKSKKGDKKNKALELAERGYKRHMAQLEADKRRDRNLRMARHVYRRMESRERLSTRQRERLALQHYCSQPLLYVMDPEAELKVTKPISIGQALESRSGYYSRRNNSRRMHQATLDTMRKADLRAANAILSRFVNDEQHERMEEATRRYKKSLTRGELSMKAKRTRELEERLGTPFAKTRLRQTRKLNSLKHSRSQTAAPMGAYNRAQIVSMPSNNSMNKTEQLGLSPMQQQRQLQPPSTAPTQLGGGYPLERSLITSSQSEALLPSMMEMGSSIDARAQTVDGNMFASTNESSLNLTRPSPTTSHGHRRRDPQSDLPVWQRKPIAHHALPERSGSWQLRRLINSTEGRWSKNKLNRGFATKMIYPTEVAGLNTLFS
jgi:hypothetical protein